MGRDSVRHLLAKRLSNGSVRYYWNPSATLRALGFVPEALGDDLRAAEDRARVLNQRADEARRERREGDNGPPPGSVLALIGAFQKSEDYADLKPRTQRDYDVWMREAGQTFGALPVAALSRKVCKEWVRAVREARGQAAAYHAGSVLRRLLSWAASEDWIKDNPALRLRLKAPQARSHVWTAEDRAAFATAATAQGWPSMALAVELAFCIGQSPVDVWGLKWSDYDGRAIASARDKTGAGGAPIPLFPELRAALDALPRTSVFILVNEATGRPWIATSTRHKAFAAIRAAAGLPRHLQFADLRRTALTDLGAAGATDDEIRAVSRHKTRGVVAVYVRPDHRYVEAAQAKRRTKVRTRPPEMSE